MIWVLLACATARRGEPIAGPLPLHNAEVHGRALFARSCSPCHPGGEAGLGPALNNLPLPGFVIRAQIRLGIGAMPPLEELDAVEVGDIVAYMGALRRHAAGP